MLNLVLVDASLELVPYEILRHPSVRRNAKRRGKRPEETLLNRSIHHYAMDKLENSNKRGRPDIFHISTLTALGTPLNKQNKLRLWVNTIHGLTIQINPETRLPRDCNRFNTLVEQLFTNGQVPIESSDPLMSIQKMPLSDLIKEISPSTIIAMSSHGEDSSSKKVAKTLTEHENPLVMIGAFPTGPMNASILELADAVYSIYTEPLETWTVTGRILYDYEQLILACD